MGGGGGTRILSYIRRLGSFFGVQNFLGVFKKINIFFFWYEEFVDIFGGSSQNWTIFLWSFLCILGSFKVTVQNGEYFFGVGKISNKRLRGIKTEQNKNNYKILLGANKESEENFWLSYCRLKN